MGYNSNFFNVPCDQDSWHGSFLPNYKQLQRSNEKLGGTFLIVSMSCLCEYPWSECVLPLWVQLWEALDRFNFSDFLGLTAQEKSFLIVSQFARLTIVYKIFHIHVVCSDESPWQHPGEWEREDENYYPSSSSACSQIQALQQRLKCACCFPDTLEGSCPFLQSRIPMAALMPSRTSKAWALRKSSSQDEGRWQKSRSKHLQWIMLPG